MKHLRIALAAAAAASAILTGGFAVATAAAHPAAVAHAAVPARVADCQRDRLGNPITGHTDCAGGSPLVPYEVVGSGQYWPTYPGIYAYDATTCKEFDQGGHLVWTNTVACTPTQSDVDSDSWHDNADNCPTVWNAGQPGLPNGKQWDNDGDGIGNACDPTPNGDTSGGALNADLTFFDGPDGTIDYTDAFGTLDGSTCGPNGKLGRVHMGVKYTDRITGFEYWRAVVAVQVCVDTVVQQVTRMGGATVSPSIAGPPFNWIWSYGNDVRWSFGLMPARSTFAQAVFSFSGCPVGAKVGVPCTKVTVTARIDVDARRGTSHGTATFA